MIDAIIIARIISDARHAEINDEKGIHPPPNMRDDCYSNCNYYKAYYGKERSPYIFPTSLLMATQRNIHFASRRRIWEKHLAAWFDDNYRPGTVSLMK